MCRTFPAAAPNSGPTLPSTKVTGYDFWLSPTTTVETSGAATRTSEVKYDAAGRAIWTKTFTTGVAGSVATDAIFTQYNQTTGLVDAVGVSNAMNTGIGGVKDIYTYDRWGKETSYTNQLGEKTTTTYDSKARVTTVADPKGTTTFEYNGTDANGQPERRGTVTKQTVTRTGTEVLTYTAAYDANGAMTTEKMPGGIIVTHHVDEAGEETGLTYSGQLTDPDTGNKTTGDWIAWSQTNDILGRVRTDATTFASAIATSAGITPDADTTEPIAGNPLAFDHRYTYDNAGHLAKVEDLTGTPIAGSEVSPYTVRDYTFTTNGARKTQKETIRADGTPTGAATTGINQTLTNDTADRLTGGYVYDLLGRQTTIPAAHAPNQAGGNITLGYFDNDLAQKVTQNGTATTFTLDTSKRRLVQTSVTAGKTTTATRHYTDSSDNPAWIETTRPDGTSETLRYAGSISGDLGATIATNGGVSLMLSNIHGDIVTTVPIPAGPPAESAAEGITGWASYTEYGAPIDQAQVTAVGTSAGYGWLGDKERSTTAETANLTLMGVRLYNRITGAFTSLDPVPGGNATAYNYPTDPINQADTDGNKGKWKKRLSKAGKWAWKNKTKIASGAALGACIILSAGACAVAAAGAAAVSIGSNAYKKKKLGKKYSWGRFAGDTALDVTLAFVPGFRYGRGAAGTVKKVYKHLRGHRNTHRFPITSGRSTKATIKSHRRTFRQSYSHSFRAHRGRYIIYGAAGFAGLANSFRS